MGHDRKYQILGMRFFHRVGGAKNLHIFYVGFKRHPDQNNTKDLYSEPGGQINAIQKWKAAKLVGPPCSLESKTRRLKVIQVFIKTSLQ